MEALRILDIITVAVKRSGRWMLLLDFWPTDDEEDDWSWLSWTLPWVYELRGDHRNACVCTQLRRHGLALVACENEEEARKLLDQIRGFRVGAKVFTGTGEETNWSLPDARPPAPKSKEKRIRKRSPRPKKEKGKLLHATFHGSSTKH